MAATPTEDIMEETSKLTQMLEFMDAVQAVDNLLKAGVRGAELAKAQERARRAMAPLSETTRK